MCGPSSRGGSASHRFWSSTPRPKATCRCSMSRASRAPSAGSRRFSRIESRRRWRNSTATEAIATCPGVIDAVVYGVTIPGTEGRAGMAAVAVGHDFNLFAFRRHLGQLPEYARPLFLRIRGEIELTSTFKPKKQDLLREGYDPAVIGDAVYFNDSERQAFVRLDRQLYDRIQTGEVRL